MRVLLRIEIPVEAGNEAIRTGAMPKAVMEFAEKAKPEAMYFTVANGARTMFAVLDMASAADMPRLLEPVFMGMNARIDATPCMNAEELAAGLKAAGMG